MKDLTPKEKAKELVQQYSNVISDETWYDLEIAKQCALIAVEEILKYSRAHGFIGLTEEYEQVKQEIEKL